MSTHRNWVFPFILCVIVLAGCAPANDGASMAQSNQHDASAAGPSRAGHFAVRLKPGDDPRRELERFAKERGLRAAAVVSAVGSLSVAVIRMAGESAPQRMETPLEVIALTGTLSPDGAHLHIAVSDATGKTTGGHLSEGSMVRTTLEVVLVELTDLQFSREQDAETGYKELRIAPR